MRNWFYIKDGEKIGPIEESELCEMLQVGVLDPDVKVWTKGLEDWASAKDVNVFDFLDDLPPPTPKVTQKPRTTPRGGAKLPSTNTPGNRPKKNPTKDRAVVMLIVGFGLLVMMGLLLVSVPSCNRARETSVPFVK